jgi:hypothetical protein
MSYSKYKAVLIIFVGLFVLLAVLDRLLDTDSLSRLVSFVLGLSIGLSLFFFLLYAKKIFIKDYDGKLAPSKLFPIVSSWLIFAAIAYPISMSFIYTNWQSLTDKYIQWEKVSVGLKNEAYRNKSAASRLNAASVYYKYFGEEINYLDEKNQNKLYSPDESATAKRMNFIEDENKSRHLKLFMLFSSIMSLLSGIIVTIIYLRQRKIIKLRQ